MPSDTPTGKIKPSVNAHAMRKILILLLLALPLQGCELLAGMAKGKAQLECEKNRDIGDYQRCRGQPGQPPPDLKR